MKSSKTIHVCHATLPTKPMSITALVSFRGAEPSENCMHFPGYLLNDCLRIEDAEDNLAEAYS